MKTINVLSIRIGIFLAGLGLAIGAQANTPKWIYVNGDEASQMMTTLNSLGARDEEGSYLVSGLNCRSALNGKGASCAFRDGYDAARSKSTSNGAWDLVNQLQKQGVFAYRQGSDSVKLTVSEIRCGASPAGPQNPYEPPVMDYTCTVTP